MRATETINEITAYVNGDPSAQIIDPSLTQQSTQIKDPNAIADIGGKTYPVERWQLDENVPRADGTSTGTLKDRICVSIRLPEQSTIRKYINNTYETTIIISGNSYVFQSYATTALSVEMNSSRSVNRANVEGTPRKMTVEPRTSG
jgi:hypothetical protein